MKLTKKLFIAIMTMALLVVTFGTSTFAWFTLGNESKIENIHINVMAGAGMEISTDGVNWKNNIELTDAESNAIHFAAITTYKGNDAGIKFYDENGVEVTNPVADLYENDPDTQNVKVYFEKDFYVRLTKRDRDIDHATDESVDFSYVALTEVTTNDTTDYSLDANKWIADVDFGGTAYTDQTAAFAAQTPYAFNPLNAVKMSFQANGGTAVLFGYEGANSNGGVALNGIAKAYAVAKGYTLTAPANAELPTYVNTASDGTLPAANADNALKVLVAGDFKAADQITFPAWNNAQPAEADNFLYAKVTVRIWLDGWDADCINAILDKETSISFKLTAYKKNA